MTLSSLRSLSLLALLCLATTSLSGCFILLGDDDDDDDVPVVVNAIPDILEEETWWRCDLDTQMAEYFFEFQALVDDADGLEDVEYVDITVFDAETGQTIDGFSLINEGDGVWGGLVWESESALFCGEAIDVLFEAWDLYEGYDSFMLYYF